MQLDEDERDKMNLTEKNIREKEFHNKLQSNQREDLKIFFIKQFIIQ